MMLVSPQHEGRKPHEDYQPATGAYTPLNKNQPTPSQLMERDGRRTLSPDGTS